MSDTIQLEVGNRYKTFNGETVEIIEYCPEYFIALPFVGRFLTNINSNNLLGGRYFWGDNGRFNALSWRNEYDIIEEIYNKKKELKKKLSATIYL
jgi:hypothetical protein